MRQKIAVEIAVASHASNPITSDSYLSGYLKENVAIHGCTLLTGVRPSVLQRYWGNVSGLLIACDATQ